MENETTPEMEMKKLASDFKNATDEVKKFAETAASEMKNLGKMTEETKAGADKAISEMGAMQSRITEIEQKMVRRSSGPAEQKSIGQLVIESDAVKEKLLSGAQRGNVSLSFERKTITSGSGSWGSGTSATNSLVVADRQPLVALPMRKMTVRDLVSPGNTDSNAVEYAVQTTRTNAAAPVAENTAKPYSNYVWNLVNFPVRTIAHMIKASRQILADAAGLQSTINAEATYGLALAEEGQLIAGDNSGADLNGLIPQATAYSTPITLTSPTDLDTIRAGILQATLALYPVDGIVLHPTDWTKIELTKDGMGRYIVGSPLNGIQPILWNLPVVESLAMNVSNFMVGAFKYGAQIFDRETVNIQISTENVDDFEKNMVSIRCEERLAFVVKRPGAFIYGALPQ